MQSTLILLKEMKYVVHLDKHYDYDFRVPNLIYPMGVIKVDNVWTKGGDL